MEAERIKADLAIYLGLCARLGQWPTQSFINDIVDGTLSIQPRLESLEKQVLMAEELGIL